MTTATEQTGIFAPFPRAEDNPELKLAKPYLDEMDEYTFSGSPERRRDFWENNFSIGYKIHLNVPPEKVRAVSRFLKENDFAHKYLSGGDVSDGKIFTIYLGSKKATITGIKKIYLGIGKLLLEPLAKDEKLYAPNIVGRFVGTQIKYDTKSSFNGMTRPRELRNLNLPLATIEEMTRKNLLEDYGNYFGGGIDYWEPSPSQIPSTLKKFFNQK